VESASELESARLMDITLRALLTLRRRPIGVPVLITVPAGLRHAPTDHATTDVVTTAAAGGGSGLLERPLTFEGILK